MPVAVARLRRAAVQLKAENQKVTTTSLAEVMQVPYLSVLSTLKINGVREEIGITDTVTASIRSQYVKAVAEIREKGEIVSRKSITAIIKKKERTVRIWLERHPEFCSEFSVMPSNQVRRTKRVHAYEAAAKTLRKKRQGVAISSIARQVEFDSSQVYKDFKNIPSLASLLAVET